MRKRKHINLYKTLVRTSMHLTSVKQRIDEAAEMYPEDREEFLEIRITLDSAHEVLWRACRRFSESFHHD